MTNPIVVTKELTLTKWLKHGDHPLVKENTVQEFTQQEMAYQGCGFVKVWIAVWPGSYILEINGEFVAVLNEETALKLIS